MFNIYENIAAPQRTENAFSNNVVSQKCGVYTVR